MERDTTTATAGTIHVGTHAALREIHGRPAARGRCVGTARVISGDRPVEPLEPGDVLICRAPQAEIALLLARAGALVFETGGALANPATLARERGIPAVVVDGATSLIRNGQLVVVDGDRGTVRVLS